MYERWKVLEKFEKQPEIMEKLVPENIEKYRKGDGVVMVCDGSGKPIPNARVEVKQTDHEFRFGANIFMLDEMETPEKNVLYKKYFAETFNMATR